MKKNLALLMTGLVISLAGMSQDTTGKVGKAVGKTVNTVGNSTAHAAVKTTSAIVDKKYKDKTGPNGEAIYINNKSKYYYVDGKGKKVFLSKAELKDKEPKH